MSSISNISDQQYKEIEEQIASDESVVGIDAKKTHILILHMLQQLDEKITRLEEKIEAVEKKQM